MGRSSTAQVSMDIMRSPEWREWVQMGQEAQDYLSNVRGKFAIRDNNYTEMFELRHGLVQAYLPPSHKEVVPIITSKEAGEIIVRLVAIRQFTRNSSFKQPPWIRRAAYKPRICRLWLSPYGWLSKTVSYSRCSAC